MSEYLILIRHQKDAVRTLVKTPQCALFALPGSGKTAIALSVIKITGESSLVIAPLSTAVTTWPNEIEHWMQFKNIDYAIAHGKRKAEAFAHDVTIINPEGIKWLFENQHLLESKTALFVDESTFFGNWSSKGTKMIRKMIEHFDRRHIMTGTPTPKTLLGLFSQQYIVDMGASYGTKITHFRPKFFYPGGYKNYEWIPFDTTLERMAEMSKGRTYVAENADYKTPGLHFIDEEIPMPDEAVEVYKRMVSKLVVTLDDKGKLTAFPAKEGEYAHKFVAKDLRQRFGKLRQIACGALYHKDGNTAKREYSELHRAKVNRCKQIVNDYGGPVVIGYNFIFELDWLREAFKGKKFLEINGASTKTQKQKAQRQWEAGKLDLLFVHPKSGAHGINLHKGGRCLVLLSMTDNPELYTQLNARIDRMGAEGVGYVYRLMSKNTVEKDVILARHTTRASVQDLLIAHCKSLQKRV